MDIVFNLTKMGYKEEVSLKSFCSHFYSKILPVALGISIFASNLLIMCLSSGSDAIFIRGMKNVFQ